MKTEAEIWLMAWLASINSPSVSTINRRGSETMVASEWADDCIKDFRKRFPETLKDSL